MNDKIRLYVIIIKIYGKAIPRNLFIAFVFLMIYIFANEFCLNYHLKKEEYPNWYSFRDIFENISYAYVTGFIFYLLTVVFPKTNKMRKVFTHLQTKTSYVVFQIDDLFKSLAKQSNNPENYRLNIPAQELYENLLTITAKGPYKSELERMEFDTLLEYIFFKLRKIKGAINELLIFYDLLSPDYLKYLTRIENAVSQLDVFGNNQYKNNIANLLIQIKEMPYYASRLNNIAKSDFWDRYYKVFLKESIEERENL